MSQDLFPGFPMVLALALAALVVVLLGLLRVLASLGRPAPLRMPQEAPPAAQDLASGETPCPY